MNSKKTYRQNQGSLSFIIILLAFFAGFIYTQLQTASLINHSLIRINTLPQDRSSISTQTTNTKKITRSETGDKESWGIAQKIGEHTYTIKLGQDGRMGTPHESYDALNVYRQAHGVGQLQWDDTLAHYAQSRADLFKANRTTDAHRGLNEFLDKEDGFIKLGFNRIGENSYYGGPLLGVHVIEWLFASSPEHNANQLDSEWTHAGVGVTSTSVDIIFGGGKM